MSIDATLLALELAQAAQAECARLRERLALQDGMLSMQYDTIEALCKRDIAEAMAGFARLQAAQENTPIRRARVAFCRHCQRNTLRIHVDGRWRCERCHPVAGANNAS